MPAFNNRAPPSAAFHQTGHFYPMNEQPHKNRSGVPDKTKNHPSLSFLALSCLPIPGFLEVTSDSNKVFAKGSSAEAINQN